MFPKLAPAAPGKQLSLGTASKASIYCFCFNAEERFDRLARCGGLGGLLGGIAAFGVEGAIYYDGACAV